MSELSSTVSAVHISRMNRCLAQLAYLGRELRKANPESAYRLVVLRRIDRRLDEYLTLLPIVESIPHRNLKR